MYQPLEPRLLFATLGGTVFADADGSATRSSDEGSLKGWTVYLDANADGRYDAGERTTTTGKTGNYTFKDVPSGTAYVGVVAQSGYGETTPGVAGADQGTFDITLQFESDITPAEGQAFAAAAARWESVITRDLPAVGGTDDLKIDVTIDHIDGDGGTLGQSDPTRFRDDSGLPYAGEMEFDKADIQDLIDEGHLTDTVTHEMAHVLGFGTIWDDLGLITGEGSHNPRFTGREATKQYDKLFDTNALSVPVESQGGDGTADSHWPERTFVEELMTGYDEDKGTAEPLSTITVGQFADEGYTVNYHAADAWDPLNHTTTLTTPADLGAKAFERRVTTEKGDVETSLDFGYRTDAAPIIHSLTATDATLGDTTTLTARHVTDAEGDAVAGVSFYAETNGKAGFQSGHGGDTYLGAATGKAGVYRVSASTTALSAGTESFYAVASDALGVARRRETTATLTAPPAPTRPTTPVTTRQSPTTVLFGWRDHATNELGFRVQIATDADYGDVVQTFNVPTGTSSTLLDDLAKNATYYVRVRAYGYGGASAYARSEPFKA